MKEQCRGFPSTDDRLTFLIYVAVFIAIFALNTGDAIVPRAVQVVGD